MKKLDEILKTHADAFAPVVSFEPETDRLIALDLTPANTRLTEDIYTDTGRFIAFINETLAGAGARYAIGGYAEHRGIYGRSDLFHGDDEPRRLHLGIDIWGAHGTAVRAPMNAIVHSLKNNDNFGDYGATIILTHNIGGQHFYTLYGHLSHDSLTNLHPGDTIMKGDVFASFGIPAENGGWPPHLHFQVIADMQNREGDYPGVCKYSEKDEWLNNSPDADLILQLNRYIS